VSALKYWVWLSSLPGLQNRSKLLLLHHFADPEEVYFAAAEAYEGIEELPAPQRALLENKSMARAEEILSECAKKEIFLITMADSTYPARLKNIYDPPILLYGRGKMPLFDDEVAVAVVGTRKCTPYGVACAEKLGYELTKQGALVVSGMARGIDAAAALGALRSGGMTCAVLGCGVDVVYPPENQRLYEDILATGVILSEYPPRTAPDGWRFPERNRIMSGLSVGSLVVEAPEHSGALITAEDALEQGREVFAVPGPIDAPESRGCHQLIREGAGLVTCAWDLLEEYVPRFPDKLHRQNAPLPKRPKLSDGPQAPAKKADPAAEESAEKLPCIDPAAVGLSQEQAAILCALDAQEAHLSDEVAEKTELPMHQVLSALTMLEIDGYVTRTDAQGFVRTVNIKQDEE